MVICHGHSYFAFGGDELVPAGVAYRLGPLRQWVCFSFGLCEHGLPELFWFATDILFAE
jgi:hypothetical protein